MNHVDLSMYLKLYVLKNYNRITRTIFFVRKKQQKRGGREQEKLSNNNIFQLVTYIVFKAVVCLHLGLNNNNLQ